MVNTFSDNILCAESFGTGLDLPWQALAYRPNKKLQFQFSHSFMAEEQEQMLAELAARLEAVFDLVFATK